MSLIQGKCPRCKVRWWWTGELDSIPACSCGRMPNADDVRFGKTEREKDDAAERVRRRGVSG